MSAQRGPNVPQDKPFTCTCDRLMAKEKKNHRPENTAVARPGPRPAQHTERAWAERPELVADLRRSDRRELSAVDRADGRQTDDNPEDDRRPMGVVAEEQSHQERDHECANDDGYSAVQIWSRVVGRH
ncbi:MAG: hypothetical protein EA424_12380, partial [Planctomycetaceae bacterium]